MPTSKRGITGRASSGTDRDKLKRYLPYRNHPQLSEKARSSIKDAIRKLIKQIREEACQTPANAVEPPASRKAM